MSLSLRLYWSTGPDDAAQMAILHFLTCETPTLEAWAILLRSSPGYMVSQSTSEADQVLPSEESGFQSRQRDP